MHNLHKNLQPKRGGTGFSPRDTSPLCWVALLVACPLIHPVGGEEPPRTGPGTEKRFPPLNVPPGFHSTLFACDPLIEYPSAIGLGPRAGSIFLAQDYLTGLGTEIVRRDEIRLVEDTDGDGYADKSTLVAGELNSVQGLCYHEDTLYAMHSPLLTAFRDTDGDGAADQRRDLLAGLGLPPAENPLRLHCANGLAFGHDGWLYLALGDHGASVSRAEGDRLVLEGGGILRVRPDGSDLHVFSTGLRNIYDVVLDEELNVFVRDNENDGGDYKIRVCHSFFGADHGYPYLYHEKPEEALRPLADLGLGSSAGGLCYLETTFPLEYRGSLFFCEWGRAVVTYHPERTGASFASVKEAEFASGAENDPYGFKPTDLAVDRDGSLLVADWADGQRPRRGRGRVYRIRFGAEPAPVSVSAGEQTPAGWLARLDSESYHARVEAQGAIARSAGAMAALRGALGEHRLGVRGRFHAVWALARAGGEEVFSRLLGLAEDDPDPRVRAQAVRALADLTDPVLVRDRLDAGPGDLEAAARLSRLAAGQDARVRLEVTIALGRLRWTETPRWLARNLEGHDPALEHAAQQALRRSENWSAALKLIDGPESEPIRGISLRALSGRAESSIVGGLIERLGAKPESRRRLEYADVLIRVHRKPAPWVYWGYRPAPRPANTLAWEDTRRIEEALDSVLEDGDNDLRAAVLRRMQRERIPARLETLARWLAQEDSEARVAVILDSLRDRPEVEGADLLAGLVRKQAHAVSTRLSALELLDRELVESAGERLLELARSIEDGPVLAAVLRSLGRRPKLASGETLLRSLSSPDPETRAAAIETLARLGTAGAEASVRRLLEDSDPRVRLAAASACGKLKVTEAVEPLLRLARAGELDLQRASLQSLQELKERRAIPIAVALLDRPGAELAALECLLDLGGPEELGAISAAVRKTRSLEILNLTVRTLARWEESQPAGSPHRRAFLRAAAEVQGESGVLLRWMTTGPLQPGNASLIAGRLARSPGIQPAAEDPAIRWTSLFGEGTESLVKLGPGDGGPEQRAWLSFSDIFVTEETLVSFLASATGALAVWSGGQRMYERTELRAFRPDSERFEATLTKGENRIVVQITSRDAAQFQVRFRRKSTTPDRERLAQVALARRGNVEHGRALFLDAQKSQCVRCHLLEGRGGRIGPDLSGAGSRFSRVHLIESVLEPSRTTAAGHETVAVVLRDGRVLTGVRVAETETALTLGDNQGETHELPRDEILEIEAQAQSLMPEGLEKLLTETEFVDLIEFLQALKETTPQTERHEDPGDKPR